MTERECITNFRVLPPFMAAEIAKHFQLELRMNKTTQWGIGKYNVNEIEGCGHWMMCVNVADKRFIPNLCFKTRKEVEEYCQAVGTVFPDICLMMFGTTTASFSSN